MVSSKPERKKGPGINEVNDVNQIFFFTALTFQISMKIVSGIY